MIAPPNGGGDVPRMRDFNTAAYMDLSDADVGHLVVFDMREGRPWAEKVYREERDRNGTPITVSGA